MQKMVIILAVIIFILLVILLFVPTPKKGRQPSVSSVQQSAESTAVEKAKQLFVEKKAQGVNLENGPCLSEEIIPDWVVDVAHDPRQDIDNFPENQCQSYSQGKTHHFIELDPDGNVIKVY